MKASVPMAAQAKVTFPATSDTGQTSFDVGFVNGLYSFTAAVVGGIGNIRGAALGALMIGVISALSNQLLTSSDWSKALVFLILVLVLVFKPTGLLGSDGGEKA